MIARSVRIGLPVLCVVALYSTFVWLDRLEQGRQLAKAIELADEMSRTMDVHSAAKMLDFGAIAHKGCSERVINIPGVREGQSAMIQYYLQSPFGVRTSTTVVDNAVMIQVCNFSGETIRYNSVATSVEVLNEEPLLDPKQIKGRITGRNGLIGRSNH